MSDPNELAFRSAVASLDPKKEYPDTPMGRAVAGMQSIPGFFTDVEAYELYLVALHGLAVAPAIAEIGSFHGRSTSVLAAACRDVGKGKVYAIDPHQGKLYEGTTGAVPSLGFFLSNMKRLELLGFVAPIVRPSTEAVINEPVGHLFIDGLHDYENVKKDINHSVKWVAKGGFVSFHDYWPYDLGVIEAVDEFMRGGGYEFVSQKDRLRTVKKL